MYNVRRNFMIYATDRDLGSASPEVALENTCDESVQDSADDVQPNVESLFPEDSYQMLQDISPGWEIPFGVWNNDLFDQFNAEFDMDMAEGFPCVGAPFQ